MTTDSAVDQAALERLREWGGQKLITQMIRLYMENVEARILQIDDGLASPVDLGPAEQGAHSLKSSASNVGAHAVSRISAEMEEAANSGDEATVRSLRAALGTAVADANHELNRILEHEES